MFRVKKHHIHAVGIWKGSRSVGERPTSSPAQRAALWSL